MRHSFKGETPSIVDAASSWSAGTMHHWKCFTKSTLWGLFSRKKHASFAVDFCLVLTVDWLADRSAVTICATLNSVKCRPQCEVFAFSRLLWLPTPVKTESLRISKKLSHIHFYTALWTARQRRAEPWAVQRAESLWAGPSWLTGPFASLPVSACTPRYIPLKSVTELIQALLLDLGFDIALAEAYPQNFSTNA